MAFGFYAATLAFLLMGTQALRQRPGAEDRRSTEFFETQILNALPGGQKALDRHLEMVNDPAIWKTASSYDNLTESMRARAMLARQAKLHDWKNALGPILQCPSGMLQTYGSGEGAHHVCIEPSLGGKSSGPQDPCTVLSFGSGGRFDFETDILKARKDCSIHIFDCFTEVTDVPEEIKNQTTFHRTCLIASRQRSEVCYPERRAMKACLQPSRTYMTYSEVVDQLGLTGPPTIVKMDVEGYEWNALEEIATTAAPTKPITLTLETHFELPTHHFEPRADFAPDGKSVTTTYLNKWAMNMLNKGGYVLVNLEDTACSHCAEAAYSRLAPAVRQPEKLEKALEKRALAQASEQDATPGDGWKPPGAEVWKNDAWYKGDQYWSYKEKAWVSEVATADPTAQVEKTETKTETTETKEEKKAVQKNEKKEKKTTTDLDASAKPKYHSIKSPHGSGNVGQHNPFPDKNKN